MGTNWTIGQEAASILHELYIDEMVDEKRTAEVIDGVIAGRVANQMAERMSKAQKERTAKRQE